MPNAAPSAISRRVYERLQSMLLNDLAPGVFDRVHPFVTVAVLQMVGAAWEQMRYCGV